MNNCPTKTLEKKAHLSNCVGCECHGCGLYASNGQVKLHDLPGSLIIRHIPKPVARQYDKIVAPALTGSAENGTPTTDTSQRTNPTNEHSLLFA